MRIVYSHILTYMLHTSGCHIATPPQGTPKPPLITLILDWLFKPLVTAQRQRVVGVCR